MGAIESAGKNGGLQQDMLRTLQRYREELQNGPTESLAQSTSTQVLSSYAQAVSHAVHETGSTSMMGRNFASASGKEESRYIAARLQNFQITCQMRASEQSTAVAILDAFGGITGPSLYDSQDNPKNGGAPESVIRKYLQQKAEKELVEKAQEEFEKKREEERREDTVIPDGGQSPETATAPSRETAAPIPAATANLPAANNTATPDFEGGDAAPVPAAPSLDITV